MKTCLVVPHPRVNPTPARRTLLHHGFAAAAARPAAPAMAWCQAVMPDAILLDWRMPGMDGLEFVRRLRQHPDGLTPKVVFCSVESEIDQIREALDAGADEYLMKPFDSDILAGRLSMLGLAA